MNLEKQIADFTVTFEKVKNMREDFQK